MIANVVWINEILNNYGCYKDWGPTMVEEEDQWIQYENITKLRATSEKWK